MALKKQPQFVERCITASSSFFLLAELYYTPNIIEHLSVLKILLPILEFSLAGFDGCVGSTGATHITRWNYLGGKGKHTTSTFHLTVNCHQRIIYTTPGYHGRWNNKTLALFDDFQRGIHEGSLMEDALFGLMERNTQGILIPLFIRSNG